MYRVKEKRAIADGDGTAVDMPVVFTGMSGGRGLISLTVTNLRHHHLVTIAHLRTRPALRGTPGAAAESVP